MTMFATCQSMSKKFTLDAFPKTMSKCLPKRDPLSEIVQDQACIARGPLREHDDIVFALHPWPPNSHDLIVTPHIHSI